MTKVFVEQPLASPGSAKHGTRCVDHPLKYGGPSLLAYKLVDPNSWLACG